MSWAWIVWIVATVVIFVALEAHALRHNETTLSRFTWNISQAFPALPFFVGLVIGFLACHFWWGGIVPFAPVH